MSKRIALPKAIETIRKAKGLAGGSVATAAFMSYSHLLNVEAGRRKATEQSIELLAQALDVDINAISYEAPSEAVA